MGIARKEFTQVSNVKHVFNVSALGKVGRFSVNGLPIIQLIGSSTIETNASN